MQGLLEAFIREQKAAGQHRARSLFEQSACQFSSNDYLNLTSDARIKKIFQNAYASYPTGSGGSFVITGYHSAHQALERAFCHYLDAEDGLLFSSGYAANLALMDLLARFNVSLLVDKYIHASYYDGLRLTQMPYQRYPHNQISHLKKKWLQISAESKALITEGTFSMSGQIPDLRAIAELIKESPGCCFIDEAHSFGVLGNHGLGAVAHFQLNLTQVPLRVIPFGKSLASQGAIVVGQAIWVDALMQCARSNRYSTAMSPAHAAAMVDVLDLVYQAENERLRLKELVNYFRVKIKQSLFIWRDSTTPIQQLILGCPKKAVLFSEQLMQKQIICPPVRSPTVPTQETGLRVVLNANHDTKEIDYLFSVLDSLYEH